MHSLLHCSLSEQKRGLCLALRDISAIAASLAPQGPACQFHTPPYNNPANCWLGFTSIYIIDFVCFRANFAAVLLQVVASSTLWFIFRRTFLDL